jgi:hypothetical protein
MKDNMEKGLTTLPHLSLIEKILYAHSRMHKIKIIWTSVYQFFFIPPQRNYSETGQLNVSLFPPQ